MLVIQKINETMCEILNTDTETPFTIPTHWLQIDAELEQGDVIKVVKDEVTRRRLEKERYKEAKKEGVAFLFEWPEHVYK